MKQKKKKKHRPNLYYENRLKSKGYDLIIGVDEAGRGPLAGPVVAAAVALKKSIFKNCIDDSKKLTCRQRESAFPEIIDKSIFGIGIVNEKIIDDINILEATRMAMVKSISALLKKMEPIRAFTRGSYGRNTQAATTHSHAKGCGFRPRSIKPSKAKLRIHILIDGDIKLDVDFPFTSIIKGDTKSRSIASASILAKVTRDRIMSLYHRKYPEYGFEQHKGYPTKTHRIALKRFGPSAIHRLTFYGV